MQLKRNEPRPDMMQKSHSAHPFSKTRQDHASECAADYVELIQDLIRETGEARAVDLAARLGVSHVTVSKTLQRLARENLVTYRPYRSIFLTEGGADLANTTRKRHQLVLGLLAALGVPQEIAIQDAEGMEHHASQTTLNAIEAFLAQGSFMEARG
jgi:DtxR family manganese transport transcriptional regulator